MAHNVIFLSDLEVNRMVLFWVFKKLFKDVEMWRVCGLTQNDRILTNQVLGNHVAMYSSVIHTHWVPAVSPGQAKIQRNRVLATLQVVLCIVS